MKYHVDIHLILPDLKYPNKVIDLPFIESNPEFLNYCFEHLSASISIWTGGRSFGLVNSIPETYIAIQRAINVEKQRKRAEHWEQYKCIGLTRYGFPKDALWLTEITTTEDAITFYGKGSVMAEIIHQEGDKPFVLYYHESGNLHAIKTFRDDGAEFEHACKVVAKYWN